jgi:hypothetical protein
VATPDDSDKAIARQHLNQKLGCGDAEHTDIEVHAAVAQVVRRLGPSAMNASRSVGA